MAKGKKLRMFPQGQGPSKPSKAKKPKPDATPAASAKGAAAEPATVPSSPGSMNAPAVRTLTEGRLEQMRERFVKLYGELEAHEGSAKDLQKQAADEKAEAKRIREELHSLRESIDSGVENARQADLFAHEQRPAKPRPGGPAETESQAHDIPPGRADATLAEVGRRGEELLAGGGGAGDETADSSSGADAGDAFAFGEHEPAPAIDTSLAGPTRIEAEREEPAETGA